MTRTQKLERPETFAPTLAALAEVPEILNLYRAFNYLELAADSFCLAMDAHDGGCRKINSEGEEGAEQFCAALGNARELIEQFLCRAIAMETLWKLDKEA